MKASLAVGARSDFSYRVPATKTVPNLYPEAHEFQLMPTVFATGFMVGLMEWACVHMLTPYLDEGEGSLGIHINVSHVAATVPGQTVKVDAEVTSIEGRRIGFNVRAHDGIDMIGEGTHERMVVNWEKFIGRVNEKAKLARLAPVTRKTANSE